MSLWLVQDRAPGLERLTEQSPAAWAITCSLLTQGTVDRERLLGNVHSFLHPGFFPTPCISCLFWDSAKGRDGQENVCEEGTWGEEQGTRNVCFRGHKGGVPEKRGGEGEGRQLRCQTHLLSLPPVLTATGGLV